MAKKLLKTIIVEALKEGQAEDIVAVKVRNFTSVADYFVIASGRSSRQLKALADHVADKVPVKPLSLVGEAGSEWILMDFDSVIVHLMSHEARAYYDLEKLWSGHAS